MRERLTREIAAIPFERMSLVIDGRTVSGQGFARGDWCFWEAFCDAYTWTAAVPKHVIPAGFTTASPSRP
jgi:hypothetical protein